MVKITFTLLCLISGCHHQYQLTQTSGRHSLLYDMSWKCSMLTLTSAHNVTDTQGSSEERGLVWLLSWAHQDLPVMVRKARVARHQPPFTRTIRGHPILKSYMEGKREPTNTRKLTKSKQKTKNIYMRLFAVDRTSQQIRLIFIFACSVQTVGPRSAIHGVQTISFWQCW